MILPTRLHHPSRLKASPTMTILPAKATTTTTTSNPRRRRRRRQLDLIVASLPPLPMRPPPPRRAALPLPLMRPPSPPLQIAIRRRRGRNCGHWSPERRRLLGALRTRASKRSSPGRAAGVRAPPCRTRRGRRGTRRTSQRRWGRSILPAKATTMTTTSKMRHRRAAPTPSDTQASGPR